MTMLSAVLCILCCGFSELKLSFPELDRFFFLLAVVPIDFSQAMVALHLLFQISVRPYSSMVAHQTDPLCTVLSMWKHQKICLGPLTRSWAHESVIKVPNALGQGGGAAYRLKIYYIYYILKEPSLSLCEGVSPN